MQCTQCQHPLQPNQKFCGTCGAPINVQVRQRRSIPWRTVVISLIGLFLLGGGGFLYFLQVSHEIVLWVEAMTPDESRAVATANQFLAHLNTGDFAAACGMNENSMEHCSTYDVPRYKALTEGGAQLEAIHAKRYTDSRGYMMYTVVVKQTKQGAVSAYWLHAAPESPTPPIITGPLAGTTWDQQIVKRLAR